MNKCNDFLTIYKIYDNEILYIVQFNFNPDIKIAIMNRNLNHIKKFIEDTASIKNNKSCGKTGLFIGGYCLDANYTIEISYDNSGDGTILGYLYENDSEENFIDKISIKPIVIYEFLNKLREIIERGELINE